ncbi:MAG: hypothetical protein V4685_13180 [Bacteroidota bacterium]
MKKYLVLFCHCLFLFSCSQNKNNGNATAVNDTTKTPATTENTSFIPVTSILQSELNKLDSVQVTILQITTVNNKQDSAWLPADKVKPKLEGFLFPVIDDKTMAALFKETTFNDEGTEAVTFMYDPKTTLPDSMTLRRWDVYFDPNRNKIRRVYMVKQVKENNILATQQFTWQTGKWAKIVTINNDKNAVNPVINEIKWIWDLSE